MNDYINLLDHHLETKRKEHCIRVAQVCVELSEKYSIDPIKAQTVGLLHDLSKQKSLKWSKDILTKKQLNHMDIFDIPPIHHAYTVSELVDLDEDLIKAIEDHVEGNSEISDLGKILYIADFIEPERNFKEVEIIRNMKFESLDQMYATVLMCSYQFQLDSGNTITKKTKEAVEKYSKYSKEII